MPPSELAAARKAPVLRRLPAAAARALTEQATVRELARGETLFTEGSPGEHVYLVLEGGIRISKQLGHGPQAWIALRGAREWIGELTLEEGEARSATAVAEGPARVLEIPRERFVALLGEHPDAAFDLLQTVSGRLRESDSALIDALRKQTEELVVANERLGAEIKRLRSRRPDDVGFDAFAGGSTHAMAVRKAARRAARLDVPVLLVGEPGTGKELVARCIHEGSGRAARPFLSIDGALFAEGVLEAELFGHAAGALPGIREEREGLVSMAEGGTLYIENLDALGRHTQSVLFRFLEIGEYQRLGETQVRRGDVRVLASTAADPRLAVREGRLAGELLERLDVARIAIPPLRARRRDIPSLALRLVEETAVARGVAPLDVAPSALRVLARYDYPDNADELAAEIEQLYDMLEPGARVSSRDLSAKFIQGDPSTSEYYSEAVRAFKAQIISNAVAEAGGNRARAAERLGLHRSNLTRMIRDLGLDQIL